MSESDRNSLHYAYFVFIIIIRVVEFPAYIGGIFIMGKLGCRATLSGGLILSGIACLITGLVPEGYTQTV